ncbi:MAG: hypothetical protein RLY97_790 [Pseudomonadota bacterium]
MPHEAASGAGGKPAFLAGLTDGWSAQWRAAGLRLALVWAGLIGLFIREWAAMFGQWWNTSTYNHILIIPAILLWLVGQRLPQLRQLTPQIWWPALVIFGAAAFVWVLGAFADLALVCQMATVGMLVATVPLLLGVRVTAALIFPLFYMCLLVPFGDELIPWLQDIDARMTVALLHLSQVKAAMHGVFITTPAGLFEIAEACSGVKFLIAMVAFGLLMAHVCFVSWQRRAWLMLASVVVPILANGVRSWGTVYVAQFMGAKYAGGMDHIIYGWIFFAIVIAGVIAVAWPKFDRPADAPMVDVAAIAGSEWLARLEKQAGSPVMAMAGVAVIGGGALGWAAAASAMAAPMAARMALPEVAGWKQVSIITKHWWEPRASGADRRILARYADNQGHVVDVFFAAYANQGAGKKADGFGDGAIPPDSGWARMGAGAPVDGAASDRLLATGRVQRLAQTSYRLGEMTTGSRMKLRLAVMADRLLLRARPTGLLIVSAEAGQNFAVSEASLKAFRQSIGDSGKWVDGVMTR